MILPIPIQNAFENMNDEELSVYIAGLVADGFGVGTSVYAPKEDWNQKDSKEMIELKEKVGQKRFDELNDLFNKKWADFIKKTRASDTYKNMSNEEKEAYVRKEKRRIKKEVIGLQKRK